MEKIEIRGKLGTSTILMNERLTNLAQYVNTDKAVIITDETVCGHYQQDFPQWDIITIGQGEKIKNLNTASLIYERLVDLKADRSTFIVGIGGGIVCDITGFIASTYMRGLPFGFVSTTLLSQVDASVGGKNGVNFQGFKNMVGVFNQPEFVICDTTLLQTLPERELLCGMSEVIKHAVIADKDLFSFLEKEYQRALHLDADVITRLVRDSIIIKSEIVNRDETERGERRKLNFGHTFGHAIEKTEGLPHGEAVSIGMAIAADFSVGEGLLPKEDAERLSRLITNMKLPVCSCGSIDKIVEALQKDKKKDGEHIHFVFLNDIGSCVIREISIGSIPVAELMANA
jgi:3-dehydroquinate synthase